MIVRKDIWKADDADGIWNETVLAYALGFAALANPVAGKPESWDLSYQAAVHDMNPLPPVGDLRATCQHDTWFFLPWHRMYLLHFESVLRAIIADLDHPGISDATRTSWALPYWNYQPPAYRYLPRAFREPDLPGGGGPNPLAQANRFPPVQQGTQPLDDDQVEFAGWWTESVFTLPGAPSFGGSDTSGPRHRPLDFRSSGALEQTPHGSVHMYVGRDMRDFTRAGFDPIFWLHHCNLDRLWEVWCQGGGTPRSNPVAGSWTSQKFGFLDAAGSVWSGTPAGVESTTALGYTYEDTSPPTAPTSPTRSRVRGGPVPDDESWRSELTTRPLGSADEPLVLQTTARTIGVNLASDEGVFTRAKRPAPAHIILQVGNIEVDPEDLQRTDDGDGLIGTYAIYLEGTRPGVEAFVGNLSLFGLRESMAEEGHPLAYTFDITDAVGILRSQDAWSWERANIRVQPSNLEAYEGGGEIIPIRVGNFTVSYQ